MFDYDKLIKKLLLYGNKGDIEALEDLLIAMRQLEVECAANVDGITIHNTINFNKAHRVSKNIRALSAQHFKDRSGGNRALDLYWATHLFDAPHFFDNYCLYIEKERELRKQFYLPRRKQLLPMVNALQELETGKLDLLTISCPPGIGKTTLAEFFLTWIEGRKPDLSVLGGSHNNSFLHGVYEEILRILDPNGEYKYSEVFPQSNLVKTNAKDMRADLQKAKRFESFEFSSIGSGNAGKVRASNLLYCDDLVDGIETAMSKDRLDKLYQQYYTDLRQRKIGNCKELHIATRWSVYDVIGRLESEYADSDRAKFMRFSAMDDRDESNFDYPYSLGFTTEFYRDQRQLMDDASWRALYCNEPIEREGQLYSPEELRRYFELPEREPDAVIAVCDVADGGGDYWAMPIAYQYGTDYYIEDWICDNGKPDIVEARIVNKLLEHKVNMARFESNRGGGRIAENVQNKLKERGGITKITTRWNQANKETRIVVSSGFVKSQFLFKNESVYKIKNKEYSEAMKLMTNYTMSGKNKHDDICDSLSMLTDFIASFSNNTVSIVRRPF